ncbi:GntR family transcriptional regulator [Maledivibacter halophilus]|uniref:DNA-binding transcriptional regulator, GntR family n=1 Tax=Maledivibacter halophilus TaxID=36842 RepID=A0A1T5M2P4_9FIRM|nr:GntR family transcriptional regulator [Maledivibacter halophilus]SKC82048.1 DNA-binding transcriptional regulator, GntR family [Maledivibacter halophilus]
MNDMNITERHAKESARDYALRIIKENIVSINLVPGCSVSEKELASKMGLSRTPVREALIELSKTQIVEIFPQKGSSIALIDTELVEEARFLRLVLETAIIELVCDVATKEDIAKLEENVMLQELYLKNSLSHKLLCLDDELHKQLFIICKKERTYDMLERLIIHFDRVRNLSLSTVNVKDKQIVDDHRDIVEAIKKRDKEMAKKVIKKHLTRYELDIKLIQERYPSYFKNT